jgi:hypothetical protein
VVTNKKSKFKVDLAKNITLNWTDLTSISDLGYHHRNESGVYVWGFTIDNVFIPYYLGIAENIIFRIHEHVNSIISGRYTIFHRNSLATFKTGGLRYYRNFWGNLIKLDFYLDNIIETF